MAGVMPAHPRVGGENAELMDRYTVQRGSSPRGRGKRQECRPGDQGVGLIPAWAGKTGGRRGPLAGVRAHPRVGGENAYPIYSCEKNHGSSPRGRGKPPEQQVARDAGVAHPRVGGENVDEHDLFS